MNINSITCAGCSACANICPCGAISMNQNNEGFYTPYIDESKCSNCGLCEKICPQINDIKKNTKKPKVYAVMAEDEIRRRSSSGGVFSVIANEILARGGVVCGAAFDENWVVKQTIIDNMKDLDKLRRSKYVQSFVSETLFKDIKNYLNQERYVLFVGTPCQVAGLKSYLKKDYNKLILIDLLCSKVPSAKAFRKFLSDNYGINEIKDINFRNKENGWACSCINTYTNNINCNRSWFQMFLRSLCMNNSCITCKYTSIDRVGDITMGDFWRIADLNPKLDDNKGTSLVLINNTKGENFFKKLKWKTIKKMSVKDALYSNKVLSSPFSAHTNMKLFYDKLEITDFNTLVTDCLSGKYNPAILNWWWNSNRGAILTCYALQELLKTMGYNPFVIKYIPKDHYWKSYPNNISERFANKYLNLTHWVHTHNEMRKLNSQFSTFIVGSDQVFNPVLNKFMGELCYLNFVDYGKTKISCAASFGIPNFESELLLKERVKYYLSRFNHISVREKDAVDLLRNEFNIEGTFILDPVFLIDKQKYIDIAQTSQNQQTEDFIAYYFINPKNRDQKTKILDDFSKKLNIKTVDIKQKGYGVEDWLYSIKNAKFVITDSFHCSCFSVMFHKKFLSLAWSDIDSRLNTLKEMTGINKRIMYTLDFSSDMADELLKDENWQEIDEKIKPMKEFSINWIKNAIQNNDTLSQPAAKDVSATFEAFYSLYENKITGLEDKCQFLTNTLKLAKNKNKIFFKYYKYKIFKNFVFKERYTKKANEYHSLVRSIRKML